MVLKTWIIIFSAAFLLNSCAGTEGPTNDPEQQQQDIIDPKALYFDNCASCHGVDGKLGISGASDLSSSTLTVEEVIAVLEKGRKNMPAMKEILGGDDPVSKVAEYTLELRK
jgi:mono/diheme cytochrome c family protein